MEKVVLITGSSSGIGKETALHFAENGWSVIATMRNPENRSTEVHEKSNIDLLHLDLLDKTSISHALKYAIDTYGHIDVVVNNAGYALIGPFEASTSEQVEKEYRTNILGLMDLTREVIPIFRRQRSGVIINVSSMVGRASFPLYSVYNSTKWAIEGFSESIHFELQPFNIKVKIIEPGIIKTDFYGRSMEITQRDGLDCYEEYKKTVLKHLEKLEQKGSIPKLVAKEIYKAATDGTWKLRYPVGTDAQKMLISRRLLPDWLFERLIQRVAIK